MSAKREHLPSLRTGPPLPPPATLPGMGEHKGVHRLLSSEFPWLLGTGPASVPPRSASVSLRECRAREARPGRRGRASQCGGGRTARAGRKGVVVNLITQRDNPLLAKLKKREYKPH